MITKSEPLMTFVKKYEESGLSLRVFRTGDGKRYAVRTVDPDDPKTGLGFVCAFAGNVTEANRPDGDDAACIAASKRLNAMLHESKELVMLYCLIDQESLDQFPEKYTSEDLGKSFSLISHPNTVISDEYALAKKEKSSKSVNAD